VNRLIKQFEQTRKVMKKLGSMPQMMKGMGMPGMFR
jgi:signal recognition particle GTPase